jgi:spore coat protein U-like protein
MGQFTLTDKRTLRSAVILLLLFTASGSVSLHALKFRGAAPRINNVAFTLDQEVIVTETVKVNHRGGAVEYFLTFSAGNSGDFTNRTLTEAGGAVMYYNIYDNAASRNILKDLSAQPSSSQVLTDSFTAAEGGAGGGTTHELSFTVILDPNQFPLAGQYQDLITIEMYAGTPAAPEPGGPVDTTELNITAQMDSVMELSVVPDGALFDSARTSLTLDFGVMYPGTGRDADLLVRANSSYSVSISSANGGIMPIQDATDTSTVPYTLTANGAQLDLSAGTDVLIASGAGPTTENGDRYDLRVVIGEYGMATEGTYMDSLSITVAAP